MLATRARALLAASLMIGCALGASACGSSSTKSSTNTTNTPTTTVTTSVTTSATTTTSAAKPNPGAVAAYRTKLTVYAACMRHNGIDLPPPTTSPNGIPVLKAPRYAIHQEFLTALRNCRTQVIQVLEAQRGLPAAG
jgi:hypothetical protein